MKKKTQGICKGKTKTGVSCKRKAGASGYCSQHDPDTLKKKATDKKATKKKEDNLYDLVNMVINISRAKGWDCYQKSIDEDNWRYATLSVSRIEGYQEITALVEISCDEKISISVEKTSFYSYGLDSLRRAIGDGMNALPWTKPIDEKPKEKEKEVDYLEPLYRLLRRFDILVRQLKHRYSDREPVHVNDEYDVQYILHALLRGLFGDVRAEEVSPSYAGASSRLDFLLKDEQVVIETKMASSYLKDKKIGEQLIIDIERYQSHPDCKKLICFVYDPENCIRNPVGLENDLRRKTDNIEVIVFVVPH